MTSGTRSFSNRAALLDMAQTSQELSDLALAMLWREMTSLQPVVAVINSFAVAQEEPLLLHTKKSEGYWVSIFRAPESQHKIDSDTGCATES